MKKTINHQDVPQEIPLGDTNNTKAHQGETFVFLVKLGVLGVLVVRL
jgi:hypothetical protein